MEKRNTSVEELERKPLGNKRLLIRFANKTSMSGVIFIHEAKSTFAKLTWAFLLLCAVGVMAYHVYFLISDYLQFETTTDIVIGFSNLQLPAVTICNANAFVYSNLNETSKQLQELVKSTNPKKFIRKSAKKKRFVDDLRNLNLSAYDSTTGDSHRATKGTKDPIRDLNESFQKLFMKEDRTTRFRIGHQINKMLLRCSFLGYECKSKFTLYQTQEYGLTLVLYVESQEYIPGITEGYGMRITIHPFNTIPFPHESGFFVDAGRETSVSLKKVAISRLSDPYGVCTTTNDFLNLYEREYTRDSCQKMCLASTIIDQCDCFNPRNEQIFQTTRPTVKACKSAKDRQCLLRIIENYRERKISCSCPQPCEEETFEKTISSRSWPTETYAVILREAICQDFPDDCKEIKAMPMLRLSRNFVKLNVFYRDLNFQTIKEQASTENSQFFSDLGGAIGLWIGLSVLSIFEVVHLVVDICTLCCKSKRKGDNRPRQEKSPNRGHPSSSDRNNLENRNYTENRNYPKNREPRYVNRNFSTEFGLKRRETELFDSYYVYKGPNY